MTDAADLLRFDGQVALITGSGRGLGREYALMLASRGCKIMVNDVNHADADTTVADIHALGSGAAASYASVENGEAIVSETLAAFGRLDILVNNAGILTPETWAELPTASWQKTLDVNLTGVFSVTRAAWPVLVKAKYGRVILVASPAVFGAGVAAYAASKAALLGLGASLQFEARKLRLPQLRINTIIPFADTRMTRDFAQQVDEKRAQQGKKPAPSPPAQLMAVMGASKVAAMVAWLAHRDCEAQATIHEAGAGFFSQLRWARSAPLFVTAKEGVMGAPQPEHIRAGLATLADFDNGDVAPMGDGSMGGPNPVARVLSHL